MCRLVGPSTLLLSVYLPVSGSISASCRLPPPPLFPLSLSFVHAYAYLDATEDPRALEIYHPLEGARIEVS